MPFFRHILHFNTNMSHIHNRRDTSVWTVSPLRHMFYCISLFSSSSLCRSTLYISQLYVFRNVGESQTKVNVPRSTNFKAIYVSCYYPCFTLESLLICSTRLLMKTCYKSQQVNLLIPCIECIFVGWQGRARVWLVSRAFWGILLSDHVSGSTKWPVSGSFKYSCRKQYMYLVLLLAITDHWSFVCVLCHCPLVRGKTSRRSGWLYTCENVLSSMQPHRAVTNSHPSSSNSRKLTLNDHVCTSQ